MNRVAIVLLCSLLINIFSCSKSKVDQTEYTDLRTIEAVQKELYCIKEKGLYGFIDIDGNYIISPKYDYVSDFCKGVAKVSLPEQKGYFYIDCAEREVYINKGDYQFVGNFEGTIYENEPYLKLATENIPEGYICYDYLGNGMFCIIKDGEEYSDADNTIGAVILENGDYVIPPTMFLTLRPFERGMALIQMAYRGFSGYLRYDGKVFWSADYADEIESLQRPENF